MIEFVCVFLICYVLHGLGVTIGYHRLLAHRSFSCPKVVEYFWILLGYLAFQGSPIWWATMHRAHHRHVDTALDPHSPRFGLYKACVGWIEHRSYADHINPYQQTKDLIHDRVYSFLEQGGSCYRAHAVAFVIGWLTRLIILLLFGWKAALASILAGYAVLLIPLMLNVVCHIPSLGYRTYNCNDDSVNVWWVAIFALGEGWHNNHHAFPGSAKTGIRPWEFDLSWLTISLMEKLHLSSSVHVMPATSAQSSRRQLQTRS